MDRMNLKTNLSIKERTVELLKERGTKRKTDREVDNDRERNTYRKE